LTLKQIIFSNRLIRKAILFISIITFKSIKLLFKSNKKNTNIVVLAIHKMGDSVFTVPAVKTILQFSDYPVYLFCLESTVPIYSYHFNSRINLIPLSANDFMFGNRIAKRNVRKTLNRLAPGIIYDLTGSIITASILFNASADKIIGLNEPMFKSIYDHFFLNTGRVHLSEMYLEVIKKYFPVSNDILEYPVKYDSKGDILLHPSAGWKAKEWDIQKYIELYLELDKFYNCTFILEKNRTDIRILEKMRNNSIKYIETSKIEGLIEVIQTSSLMITNDTGPLHIAAMLGNPTFSIFGPTNPSFHLPFGKQHKYINKIISCSPLIDKYCFTNGGRTCPSIDCMNLLTVQEVYSSVSKFIEELGITRRNGS
jgi:ADP-heptose:LPS heptosyltransferase